MARRLQDLRARLRGLKKTRLDEGFQLPLPYFFWTLALMSFQVLEVLILGFVHYVYFPPVSLDILRVLSTLTLIPLVLSFYQRVEASQSKILEENEVREHYFQKARWVFVGGLGAAVLLVSWSLAFTNLHFSAPPIFRAVLLAGMVSLPLDALMAYLFSSAPSLRKYFLLPQARLSTILSMTLALGCLALDWPLLYLMVRILPKLWICFRVWSKISGSPFRSLLHDLRGPTSQEWSLQLRSSLLWILILEIGFYASFFSLTRQDSTAGLFIFFIHKMIHTGCVMSLKILNPFYRRLQFAMNLRSQTTRKKVLKNFIWASALASTLTLLLIPLFEIKHAFLSWASPTGDYFVIPWVILGLSVVSVVTRVWTLSLHSLPLSQPSLALSFLRFMAFILVPALAFAFGPQLLRIWTINEVFGFAVALDLLCQGGILIAIPSLLKNHSEGSRDESKIQQTTLAEFLRILVLSPAAPVRRIWKIQYWRQAQVQEISLSGVKQIRGILWHQKDQALVVADFESLGDARRIEEIVLTAQSHLIRQFDRSSVDMNENFVAPILSALPWVSTLKNLQSKENLHRVRWIAYRNEDWRLPKDLETSEIQRIHAYLEQLYRSEEFVLPTIWKSAASKGLVHINKDGQPWALGLVSPQERPLIDGIRHLCFEINLRDLLKGLESNPHWPARFASKELLPSSSTPTLNANSSEAHRA